MIVDCAVYEDGKRRPGELALDDAFEAGRSPNAFVWIGLHHPTEAEFDAVRMEFGLHELAVEDALKAHQRPKLEVYDDSLFVVLKTARYVDETETVEFAELQLFIGEGFIVTVRHGEASALGDVRHRLEEQPDLLRCGPGAVLHAVCDRVVDDYLPVVDGIDNDIDEVEQDVFSHERTNPAQRIYELKREVLAFYRNTQPFEQALDGLEKGRVPFCHQDLSEYFRDVRDHLLKVVSRLDTYRDLLTDVLEANLAQVSVRQNNDMRTISAWVAIVAVPTMMAGIWGMNFEHMPELGWVVGYPLALLAMLGAALLMYRRLRRAGWL